VGEDQFWALIAQSRDQKPGGDQMAEARRERLAQLSADEVYAFGRYWNAAFDRLFAWPVWDAASVLPGWVGDDSFRDVRAWIVSHGRSVVDRVVENPDSLADLAYDEDNAFEEGFDGIAYECYQDVAGHLPAYERGNGDPTASAPTSKTGCRYNSLPAACRTGPRRIPSGSADMPGIGGSLLTKLGSRYRSTAL
jgi:hypothetical protein